MACRNTNWQLVLDEVRLPSYETLRRFVGTEIALPAASVEGSAISFLDQQHAALIHQKTIYNS
jgi:hypothetical protein